MKYLGEHLFPGQLGHFLAILSLVASFVATISFYKSFKTPEPEQAGWRKIARIAFGLQTIAVVGIFITLYYIISNHLFEYKYAWQHSSKSLQVEYLLSCFWEGQEGSFMLWSFWHCVLGWILIWRAKRWEGPVMTIISIGQFALATMLLGIYFFGHKVGSSPFVLLRNEMEAPIFSTPNYLQFITDGNGLNALLQNYWMVIHPPILFLGFASTIVPFAFAMAGFMTGDHKGWVTPALPWGLFATAILGTGIMMGAAWAYESLTFGGYWAWDPVENASLVPWLVLVAGIHTNIIYKNSGYSLRSTYIFYVVAFLLIVYSTFLTRSGVLGDTSVHAFTDLGMNVQLFLFLNGSIWLAPVIAAKSNKERLLVFAAFAATTVVAYYWPVMSLLSCLGGIGYFIYQVNANKAIPYIQKEEHSYSREFWMFIGALVFFLSAVVIISKTSLPVFNKVFNTKTAPPEDPEYSHNQIQIWIAVIVGVLTAVTQFLRYKDTGRAVFFKKIAWPTLVALALSLALSLGMGIHYDKHGAGFTIAIHVAMFCAVYAVVGNGWYIISGLKGNLQRSGASVAHVGFGLVLLGILISSANKETLSINTTGISPLKLREDGKNDANNNPMENSTLIKGAATDMGKYMVTYTRDTFNPRDNKTYYEIVFNDKTGKEAFRVYPDIIENNKGMEGVAPNPDSKHYLTHDIFTYVTWLSDPEKRRNDTSTFQPKQLTIGDTAFYSNGMYVVTGLELNPRNGKYNFGPNDTAIAANITVIAKNGSLYKATPAFLVRSNTIEMLPDTVMSQSLIFSFNKLTDPGSKKIELGVKETSAILDFITLKVYSFPYINVLWLGIFITVTGIIMSMIRRIILIRRKTQ